MSTLSCNSIQRFVFLSKQECPRLITAVPDNNDIEAIFTWRGHGRSFVGFLSGNVWQIHLDSDFLLQFLLRLFHKLAH